MAMAMPSSAASEGAGTAAPACAPCSARLVRHKRCLRTLPPSQTSAGSRPQGFGVTPQVQEAGGSGQMPWRGAGMLAAALHFHVTPIPRETAEAVPPADPQHAGSLCKRHRARGLRRPRGKRVARNAEPRLVLLFP